MIFCQQDYLSVGGGYVSFSFSFLLIVFKKALLVTLLCLTKQQRDDLNLKLIMGISLTAMVIMACGWTTTWKRESQVPAQHLEMRHSAMTVRSLISSVWKSGLSVLKNEDFGRFPGLK